MDVLDAIEVIKERAKRIDCANPHKVAGKKKMQAHVNQLRKSVNTIQQFLDEN